MMVCNPGLASEQTREPAAGALHCIGAAHHDLLESSQQQKHSAKDPVLKPQHF